MRHDVEQTLTPEVMKIRVLIPIYRALDTDEERALKNNCRMLAAHDIALLVPEGLDVEAAAALAPQAEVVRVTDEWLGRRNGIAGYNRMMLAGDFYRMHEAWDYILVCHTDAWIFRDELNAWVAAGYDCVAAPWIRRAVYDLPLVKQYVAWRQRSKHRRGLPCRADLYGRVGNGGLSLRRVAADGEGPLPQRRRILGHGARRVPISDARRGVAIRVRHQPRLLLPPHGQALAHGLP